MFGFCLSLLPVPRGAPRVVSALGQLAPVKIVGRGPEVAVTVIRVHLTGNDCFQSWVVDRDRRHLDRLRWRVPGHGRPSGRPLRTSILLFRLINLKLTAARARLSPYPRVATSIGHLGLYETEKD